MNHINNSIIASITILTSNPGEEFKATLDAIFTQDCSFKFEVVIVDSGSIDGTLDLVKKYPIRLYSIQPNQFNFGLTRDYVFSLTRGQFIVAISQDVIPADKYWLKNLIEPFSDPDIALVQGIVVLPKDRENFYWEKVGMFYFTRECKKWATNNNGIGVSFVNCAIRRSVWENNRLEKIEMMEDKFFQMKLSKGGYKIYREMKAMCYHGHTYTVNELIKRCTNEGLGWRIVHQRYSLLDMVRDILNLQIHRRLFNGIKTKQIKRLSELLFPLIRPFFVFFGNHFIKRYVKS